MLYAYNLATQVSLQSNAIVNLWVLWQTPNLQFTDSNELLFFLSYNNKLRSQVVVFANQALFWSYSVGSIIVLILISFVG